MTIPCRACPLRPLPAFQPMKEAEVDFMQQVKIGELMIEGGAIVVAEGSTHPQIFTALSGMGLRYKLLEDGRRQVVNFIFPGDLVGMQCVLMGEMTYTAQATTDMTFCVFDRNSIWKAFTALPERGFSLTWIAAAEEHFLGDALATIGQRDATERLAWAFVRIWSRLTTLMMGGPDWVPFPYRQQDLADALGLSLVHTNKTLARLRERGLVHWSQGRLMLPDPEALARLAVIDSVDVSRRPLF